MQSRNGLLDRAGEEFRREAKQDTEEAVEKIGGSWGIWMTLEVAQ